MIKVGLFFWNSIFQKIILFIQRINNNNLIGIIMNANKDFNKKDSLNDNQMITIWIVMIQEI